MSIKVTKYSPLSLYRAYLRASKKWESYDRDKRSLKDGMIKRIKYYLKRPELPENVAPRIQNSVEELQAIQNLLNNKHFGQYRVNQNCISEVIKKFDTVKNGGFVYLSTEYQEKQRKSPWGFGFNFISMILDSKKKREERDSILGFYSVEEYNKKKLQEEEYKKRVLEVMKEVKVVEPRKINKLEQELELLLASRSEKQQAIDKIRSYEKKKNQEFIDLQNRTLVIQVNLGALKWVNGPCGTVLKRIIDETGSEISMNFSNGEIKIIGNSLELSEKTKEIILSEIRYAEKMREDGMKNYLEAQKEIEEHTQKRSEYFDASQKAFSENNSELGISLAVKGKNETKNISEIRRKASLSLFESINYCNPQNIIHIYGLNSDDSIDIINDYLDKFDVSDMRDLTIITKDSSNSQEDVSGLILAIELFIKKRGLEYQLNNRELKVILKN